MSRGPTTQKVQIDGDFAAQFEFRLCAVFEVRPVSKVQIEGGKLLYYDVHPIVWDQIAKFAAAYHLGRRDESQIWQRTLTMKQAS
ncbi:MAG: hypothetical protein ACF8CY_06780 [Gimesia chilikensis]